MHETETGPSERLLVGALFLLIVGFEVYALLVTIPGASFLVDEGWASDIANQLLKGKVLYRDASAPYGPLTFELHAMIFRLAGKSFFALRVVGLQVIALEGVFLFLIGRQLLGRRAVILVAPALLFIALGTWQGARLSASTVAGLFTVWSLYCHVRYLRVGGAWRLLATGVLLGLTFLTKHNIFAFDVIAHGTAMTVHAVKRHRAGAPSLRPLAMLPLGVLLVVVPFFISISGYVHTFYLDTIGEVGGYSEVMARPVPRPWTLLDRSPTTIVFATAFYTVFVLLAALPFVIHRRTRAFFTRPAVILVFGVGLLQLLQVFPIADYSHLSRATIVFPLLPAIVFHLGRERRSIPALGFSVLAMLLHVAPMLADQPTRIERARTQPWSELPGNAHILRDPKERLFRQVIAMVNELRPERLVVLGHGGGLRFLLDREIVARRTSISPYFIFTERAQREALARLEPAEVDVIIVAPPLKPDTDIDNLPLIHDYLRRAYRLHARGGGYRILVRRRLADEPVSAADADRPPREAGRR